MRGNWEIINPPNDVEGKFDRLKEHSRSAMPTRWQYSTTSQGCEPCCGSPREEVRAGTKNWSEVLKKRELQQGACVLFQDREGGCGWDLHWQREGL